MPDPAIDHAGRHPDITHELAGLTDRVIAARVVTLEKGYRIVPEAESKGLVLAPSRQPVQVLPPIQIRGLAADVMTVKRGFSEIREVVRDVNLLSAALKQDLHDVKAQLQGHREDIRFEAETLGNGGDADGADKSDS